jgi:hypothetical protein
VHSALCVGGPEKGGGRSLCECAEEVTRRGGGAFEPLSFRVTAVLALFPALCLFCTCGG